MAQTERDQVAIRALLPDNIAQEISPQDLRDALASMMGYGGIVLSVPGAPATQADVSTAYDVLNIFDVITAQSSDVNTNGVECSLAFGSPENHRITIKSAGIYRVDFWASFQAGSGSELVTFRPHLNGNPGLIEVDRDVSPGSAGVVAFNGIIPYAADDYVDMRVKIDAGTDSLEFLAAGFSVFRVG